jgi:hypothetical protein
MIEYLIKVSNQTFYKYLYKLTLCKLVVSIIIKKKKHENDFI